MNKNLLVGGLFLIVVVMVTTVLLVRRGGGGNNKITYAWSTAPDPGTTCNVPCGGGTRYLNVWCEAVDFTGKNVKIVDDSLCDQSSKPTSSEVCNTQACQWLTGDWSSCTLPCGGGTQSRSVQCEVSLDPSKCLGPEPPTTQTCNTQACAPAFLVQNLDCDSCDSDCMGGSGACSYDSTNVYTNAPTSCGCGYSAMYPCVQVIPTTTGNPDCFNHMNSMCYTDKQSAINTASSLATNGTGCPY